MTSILLLAVNSSLAKRIRAIPGHQIRSLDRDESESVTSSQVMSEFFGLGAENAPEIVIIGDDIPVGEALSLAQTFDNSVPDVELMLIVEADTEIALRAMRVGVREIVPPTIDGDELKVLLHRVVSNASTRLAPNLSLTGTRPVETSRVTVIASPKGGVGKSTIAVNLAVVLAQDAPMGTVLVDLDIQFGDAASLLDLKPTHSIVDAFGKSARDNLILKTFLTVHSAGFYVLCGSESPTASDKASAADVKQLLNQLSTQFRHVVVDTAAGLNEHTLAALEESDDVVFVSSMDVSSIRALRKEIDVLTELKLIPLSRHVVLNFVDRRSGLVVRDVEAVIGMPVNIVLPRSPDVLLAGNRGEPIILKKRGGPTAKAIRKLAIRLRQDNSNEKPNDQSKGATKGTRRLTRRGSETS